MPEQPKNATEGQAMAAAEYGNLNFNLTNLLHKLELEVVALPPPFGFIAGALAATSGQVLGWVNTWLSAKLEAAEPFVDAAYKAKYHAEFEKNFKGLIGDAFKDWVSQKQFKEGNSAQGIALRKGVDPFFDTSVRSRTADRIYDALKAVNAPEFMACAAAAAAGYASDASAYYHKRAEAVHTIAWGTTWPADGRDLAVSKDYPVALAAWKKSLATGIKFEDEALGHTLATYDAIKTQAGFTAEQLIDIASQVKAGAKVTPAQQAILESHGQMQKLIELVQSSATVAASKVRDNWGDFGFSPNAFDAPEVAATDPGKRKLTGGEKLTAAAAAAIAVKVFLL